MTQAILTYLWSDLLNHVASSLTFSSVRVKWKDRINLISFALRWKVIVKIIRKLHFKNKDNSIGLGDFAQLLYSRSNHEVNLNLIKCSLRLSHQKRLFCIQQMIKESKGSLMRFSDLYLQPSINYFSYYFLIEFKWSEKEKSKVLDNILFCFGFLIIKHTIQQSPTVWSICKIKIKHRKSFNSINCQ